jgi:DNA-directed RNA polymerase beta' subunit
LLITEDNIKLWKIGKNNRFDNILKKCVKLHFCTHCKSIQPKYTFSSTDSVVYAAYTNGGKVEKVPVEVFDIKRIFSNIIDTDIEILGFNTDNSRPIDLILTVLPVIPPRSRPYIVSENIICDDDLTIQLCEIIKINNNLADREISITKRQKLVQNLIFRIKTMMDNSQKKAKHTNLRPMKGIKERLCGKDGIIRSNLMGKRCNFSARTVIARIQH